MASIVNVSNRLPVTVSEGGIEKSSGGLVAALEGFKSDQFTLRWIGWPGKDVGDSRQQDEVRQKLEQDYGCSPVFLGAEEAAGHYEGLSNTTIWPLLHYMPDRLRYEPKWWDDYRAVNEKFARSVLDIAGEGDLVWVHDYQLMLLPRLLTQARPSLRIGFFLHTPFPSYEVFRCHPRCAELVEGMLGADQVGFHTFGYLRHFRSSVHRLLGYDSEITRIVHGERATTLGVYPIGINAPQFQQELSLPEHQQQLAAFRGTFGKKRLILSVERMDYTKGILRRLEAIDRFLDDCTPEHCANLKFIFVSVPSRENVSEYQTLRERIESEVGRINGRHTTLSNSPLHFIHGTVTFRELCALYAAAEVALVTPLIDGMNLVAKEFVACQRQEPGVLILSQFAGASEELHQALIVNPYDPPSVARSLAEALAMPREERARRMNAMRDRVLNFDSAAWARKFIEDLQSRKNGEEPTAPEDMQQRIVGALRSGKPIAFLLDYDGTLREYERDPSHARPTAEILGLLARLKHVPHVDLMLVSGRTPADLESFFPDADFGMVAEHGASMRLPGTDGWEHLDANLDCSWRQAIRPILELYVESTPGSFIEEKRTSLVWHYRKADPEFGEHKAKQLTEELGSVAANAPVVVRQGKKIVEIAADQISKGATMSRLLETKPYALIIAAGDDATDESMFRADLPSLLSIKIGPGETRAACRVRSVSALRRLLHSALDAAGVNR